ncbi:MAG TPA: GrpB family protein [Burkholderiaceae bacterium]|nr:GrpB family protein [Burkholderiaceae bacterium]
MADQLTEESTSTVSTIQRAIKPIGARILDWLRIQPQAVEPVVIVPYRPSWQARFHVEADLLRVALADLNPRLEHIGSTAVTGLAARPIVDMVVGVAKLSDRPAMIERLRNYGYQPDPDQVGAPPALRCLVRMVRELPTHQVHVVEAYGDLWHQLLLFRDLLRSDPLLAAEYEGLKRRLARTHATSAFAYMSAKTDFIERTLGERSVAARPRG